MPRETSITNEDLALMIKQGFDSVDKRFLLVDQRFEQIDQRFEQIDKRFEQVPTKADMRREFMEVRQRLSRLEQDRVVVQKVKDALGLD